MKALTGLSVPLFLILFCGCGGPKPFAGEDHVTPIAYTVLEKGGFLNKDNISITINKIGNDLSFSFAFRNLERLPFPINKQYRDTLSKTSFSFELLQNGQLLNSDYGLLQGTRIWSRDSSKTATNLCFHSDTVDLAQDPSVSFGFPLYALHDLKKGKQTLELSFAQELFVDDVHVEGKNGAENVHLSETKPLLHGKIRLEIDMPAIYKTMVYGQGLTLRNDSTFSPSGMDNTLFQSSYPDIYWSIFYPVDNFYVQTPYEKSTDHYEGHDTFNLYHYHLNDSLEFAVYDHDNFSRDDGLGYTKVGLDELRKAKYAKLLRFGPVAHFDVKVKTVGIIN
jgi:hypothetical protein